MKYYQVVLANDQSMNKATKRLDYRHEQHSNQYMNRNVNLNEITYKIKYRYCHYTYIRETSIPSDRIQRY